MINEELFRQWVANLEMGIGQEVISGRSTEEACALVEQRAAAEFSFSPEAAQERVRAACEAAANYRAKLESVSYMQRVAIRFGHEQWYAGPAENADNWNGLKNYLRDVMGRSANSITALDEESTTVLSLMDNPGQKKFATRGLVVGYVQSGKTANMAAVIAKAANTHFKFFLVLSGMTDVLRNQTQERIDSDVVGVLASRWHHWTSKDTEEKKGDFAHPAIGGFAFDARNQIAVMKKNAGILRRFLAKLKNTDEATLRDTPFLIIDDECDQASLNSAAYEKAITKINGYIREILKLLPRAAYVGYTATPFANVLIDPSVPEDLYPRTFIHALRRPDDYFGPERIFGRAGLDGAHDDTQDGLDMLRMVSETEIDRLRPASGAKDSFRFEVTKSLATAIKYFVLVTAARALRGQRAEHSTMLVHTSVLNSVHRKTASAVKAFLDKLLTSLRRDDDAIMRELADLWEEEQERVLPELFDLIPVSFERLRPLLAPTAGDIQIKVENWSSDNRIDYSEPARRYLVIGGNVLARGLTLEGLSVSFFLRSSSQYDTLMQMGRWFGYRRQYEDLPRVWLEQEVRDNFLDLATIEAEVRRDIRRYAEEEIKPTEFGVRIRQIPGMAITARAKMRSAKTVKIGYAGSHQQTTRFPRRDSGWLRANWDAATELVAHGTVHQRGHNTILRGIPSAQVVAFLGRYKVHSSHRQMEPTLLAQYISQEASGPWNVVVVGGPDMTAERELGRLGHVQTVRRSALVRSGEDASIKALMSMRDLFADIDIPPPVPRDFSWETFKKHREGHGLPPLLLLYPIDKISTPDNASKVREALAATHDVLGVGIVFPGSHASAQVYVSANLVPDDAVETPDGEDAIPETVTDTAQEAPVT